jgi:hypothetical protein
VTKYCCNGSNLDVAVMQDFNDVNSNSITGSSIYQRILRQLITARTLLLFTTQIKHRLEPELAPTWNMEEESDGKATNCCLKVNFEGLIQSKCFLKSCLPARN